MWPRHSHVLSPLTNIYSGPKGRKILWNDALKSPFKELKHMVSAYILITYPDWIIPFIVHTYASDKQLGAAIINNNKPIDFFSRRLSKLQHNYTTNEKELLAIVECLNK